MINMSSCCKYIDAENLKRNNYCESCGVKLKMKDWPWLFKGMLRLCPNCKFEAEKILNK